MRINSLEQMGVGWGYWGWLPHSSNWCGRHWLYRTCGGQTDARVRRQTPSSRTLESHCLRVSLVPWCWAKSGPWGIRLSSPHGPFASWLLILSEATAWTSPSQKEPSWCYGLWWKNLDFMSSSKSCQLRGITESYSPHFQNRAGYNTSLPGSEWDKQNIY